MTRFLRRALSLEAAEKQYPKTFVSSYELEGTGIRADWPVIAAGPGEVLELKEEGSDSAEVTAVLSVFCSVACRKFVWL